ncbi:methyl-accepting chemotaxis protein [Myxococcus sp. 1LA]
MPYVSHRWLSGLVWLLLLSLTWPSDVLARAASGGTELQLGWRYRWGDSPLGPDGVPVWAREDGTVGWESMQALQIPPGRGQHTLLWVSIPIPDAGWGAPALMLGSVSNAFEVYAGGQRIYVNGTLNPSGIEARESILRHMIPLPASAQGTRVMFRIQSTTKAIGITQHARVGEQHVLMSRVVREGLAPFGTGLLLVVIGGGALVMTLLKGQRRMLGALAVFAGGSGVLLVGLSNVLTLAWDMEGAAAQITFVGAYCLLPGLGWFIREGILEDRLRWFRVLVWSVSVSAAIQTVIVLVDPRLASQLFQFLVLYTIPTLLTYVVVILVAAYRGNVDARIFSVGLAALVALLVMTMLPLLSSAAMGGWFVHWGFLALTASLVGIVARRFLLVARALASHARQLEARRMDVQQLAEGMGRGAAELVSVAHGLRESSEAQTVGVSRQSAALKELDQTVQEIRQGSVVTDEKAQVLAQSVVEAEEAGREGGAAIARTLSNLEAIGGEVSEMARRILQLDSRAREISSIVDTVKGLADQSNMLAVNAAIEAARSGEHGRGFAVVSREVRSLADQSVVATQRIRDVLDSVSVSMRETAKMSEQGAQRVQTSLDAVRVSGTQLQRLTGIITDTSTNVRQISAAVSQQNAGTAQIAVAIQDMSSQMQETLDTVQDTRNVARSVQALAENMATTAQKTLDSGTLAA